MRYLIFGGVCFYAAGGAHDYLGSRDNLNDACDFARARLNEEINPSDEDDERDIEWVHVWDAARSMIVAGTAEQPLGVNTLVASDSVKIISR